MRTHLAMFLSIAACLSAQAQTLAQRQAQAQAQAQTQAQAPPPVAVLNTAQVTDVLYDTVTWYRTVGAQRASADQAGDALILYANRQIATQVVHLALDMARADAELLSSQASQTATAPGVATSAKELNSERQQLDAQARQIQAQLQSARSAATAGGAQRGKRAARISDLEAELAVVNARSNLVATMAQFVNASDSKNAGANALKEHVAAIEASLPKQAGAALTTASSAATAAARRLGIWDLTANALRLSGNLGAIDSMEQSTAELDRQFQKLSATPVAAIKALATRGDSLAAQADHAESGTMENLRNRLDTVAWQLKQASAIVLPLGQAHVLLAQYRHNLDGWRDILRRQERAALMALGARIGILVLVLAALIAGGELWRRAVLRFEQEPRRRRQWLLVRRVILWSAVVIVVGFTFVTQISSIATFAGLITAGLAVAMQSVLVSVVGYFFLIGRYGVRVGDRVQIGSVSGEVVELGLVRMHLMELGPDTQYAPTGRIVAFANSVVFQASGGLFRQIPGVNFAWHDLTLTLPGGVDYATLKAGLLSAATDVVKKYQNDLVYETGQLQDVLAARDSGKAATARVQLQFSASQVQAHVWYPVYLPRAAEIDERVSQELWRVMDAAKKQSGASALTSAAPSENPPVRGG